MQQFSTTESYNMLRFSQLFITDLCSWCVAAGWGSWRWGRRCARRPTPRTQGRSSPRSPPIGLSPASRSAASGPSLAPSANTSLWRQRHKPEVSTGWCVHECGTKGTKHACARETGGWIKLAPPTSLASACGDQLWFHRPGTTCHLLCMWNMGANICVFCCHLVVIEIHGTLKLF